MSHLKKLYLYPDLTQTITIIACLLTLKNPDLDFKEAINQAIHALDTVADELEG